jgi:hypothetical protein
MVRAIVLWKQSPDADWYERHAEIARSVPGATFRAGRIFGSPSGEPDHQHYAEFEFPDRDSFKEGMNSSEMSATVQDANSTGIPFVVYFVDVD